MFVETKYSEQESNRVHFSLQHVKYHFQQIQIALTAALENLTLVNNNNDYGHYDAQKRTHTKLKISIN